MTKETTAQSDRIEYISQPLPVSMGDAWYEHASPDHFWMRRRFQVLRRLVDPEPAASWGEVGCGHGAVQLQMDEELGIAVDGIDLNEEALRRSIARRGRLLCYNILDRESLMHESYDNVILFDVLEHIGDDQAFFDSALHLVRPGGSLIINVPAFMQLWSPYDLAAGHVRRYTIAEIARLVESCENLSIRRWTYWGAPFLPLLYARKVYLKLASPDDVIKSGFSVRNQVVNRAFSWLSRCEWIPQHCCGTSLMLVIDRHSA